MRILGVDPGTIVTGYGVVDCENGKLSAIDYGIIRMKPSWSMPLRLREIYSKLQEVFDATVPDEFAIESAFYSKNIQSTLKLGHARGVSILAAVLRQIPTAEYAPREVKLAVTGSGKASKEQVEYMVMTMLGITERTASLDATDALAVAICHAGRITGGGSRRGRSKTWGEFVDENPARVVRAV